MAALTCRFAYNALRAISTKIPAICSTVLHKPLSSLAASVNPVAYLPSTKAIAGFNLTSRLSQWNGPTLLRAPVSSVVQPLTLSRNLTTWSMRKGTMKTNPSLKFKFLRLNWGGWIRTRVGRHKKLYMKSRQRRHRLRQHVICHRAKCHLYDRMVSKFWKEPKFYIDDPYAHYHYRHNMPRRPYNYE